MDKKAVKAIQNLSLEPPRQAEKTGYDVLDKWYDYERSLRIALSYLRAQKMKKDNLF